MERAVRIGVDLGGTKIEVIAIDRAGSTLAQRRVTSPRGDYAATLEAIREAVAWPRAWPARMAGSASATPGTLSRVTGRLKNSNSTWLNGQPLLQDVERILDRPVRIANDADCFALSESVDVPVPGPTWCSA